MTSLLNHSTNLSVFQRNTLACFVSPIAEKAYLWAIEQGEELRAFDYASEVDQLAETLAPMLVDAARTHGLENAPVGLLDFMLKRHRYWRFPNARAA